MAVDDLWYLTKRGPDGERIRSARHGRGRRWRVRWTDPDSGRERTSMFEKKSDADRHDANMRADISRGQYIDPSAGKVTVAEYADEWRRTQIHIDSTIEIVERNFRLHIRPLLGDLPMSSVRPGNIRAWIKNRSAPGVLAPSTVALAYGYLASMFRSAVNDRVIGRTPCVGIQLPALPAGNRYIPTLDEVHAVAAALPERYRAAVWLAAGCGLRAQEILGLEIDAVDWLRREIHVRQQIRQAPGRPMYVGRVKTPTSRRIVEMPAVTAEELARLVQTRRPEPREMEDLTDPSRPTVRAVELLFTTINRRPPNRSGWSKVWRSALRRADVTPGWGLHSLRHWYATRLIHGGASVKTVQLSLGHSKPSITLDTYTHEWPDLTERTRSLIDAALDRGPVDELAIEG